VAINSDIELKRIVGRAKFDSLSPAQRQVYKKAYRVEPDVMEKVRRTPAPPPESQSDKELRRRLGWQKFDSLSPEQRDIYKKAYSQSTGPFSRPLRQPPAPPPESQSDKELKRIVGRAKFNSLSPETRDIYKKAYRIVGRYGPKLALAALSGPAGWLAAGISEAAAATPAGAGEDQLLYKTRRKKVPGGGPDEADIKRERSNKYAKGGVAKGFKGVF
jgi:hypothetical protein